MRVAIVVFVFALGASANHAGAAPAPDQDGSPATVAVQQVPLDRDLPDEALMVLVGSALIALGAAVRRARV